MADSGDGALNLDNLSLDQLNQAKQSEESRLQLMTQRYAQLRQAAAKLNASKSAVSELQGGKQVMVPLTESLYCPGTIREPNKLLVELGTGFYVEKSQRDTTDFLDRRLKLVDANSENVTKVVEVTRQNINNLNMTMQGKLMEIRARQEGQRLRAAESS